MTDQKPKSPCVNVCVIDERSGYCRGCKRTLDEVVAWPRASDAERQAILDALPARVTYLPLLPGNS
ncbi:MAG: DUF1289 domain-containing protein [Solirubrobacterales bacterium]|nr:DUF1289 domain-containing protein [Solirubrobacterales bacterium]